jgi:hypothetical protein
MLQHAHFDTNGGKRIFAAVCAKVCSAALSALRKLLTPLAIALPMARYINGIVQIL